MSKNQNVIGGFGTTPFLALGMIFYAESGVIPRVEVKDCSGQQITFADQFIGRNKERFRQALRLAYTEVTA